jgi:feruloyl esterase
MKLSRALQFGRNAQRGIEDVVRLASGAMGSLAPSLMSSLDVAGLFSPAGTPVRLPPDLQEIAAFGSNPGDLQMLLYVPTGVRPGAPLVVVLHGCGQEAAGFAADAGWIALAERQRLPLLLPVQRENNNQGRCFNWFRPTDTRRGRGEAVSIRQMVTVALSMVRGDPTRVFIAGLSAGGAMAASVLAAYPDVFAAGAVVAGLPVGAANGMGQALARMAEPGPARSADELATLARRAGPADYSGPWPRLSIWRGEADCTVNPVNAERLALQWTALHGIPDEAAAEFVPIPGTNRRVWGPPGRPAVELWTLDNVAHAWPIEGADGGQPARWVHPASVSATAEIARFWRLS